MLPKQKSRKATIFGICSFWLSAVVICLLTKSIKYRNREDPVNYFCLPFIMSSSRHILSYVLDVVIVSVDICLVLVCVICYTYLLVFSSLQADVRSLRNIRKRRRALQKVSVRMAVLILSSSMTWIPVLIVQLLILSGMAVPPDIFLWIVLVCFPANLVLDPVLFIKQVM